MIKVAVIGIASFANCTVCHCDDILTRCCHVIDSFMRTMRATCTEMTASLGVTLANLPARWIYPFPMHFIVIQPRERGGHRAVCEPRTSARIAAGKKASQYQTAGASDQNGRSVSGTTGLRFRPIVRTRRQRQRTTAQTWRDPQTAASDVNTKRRRASTKHRSWGRAKPYQGRKEIRTRAQRRVSETTGMQSNSRFASPSERKTKWKTASVNLPTNNSSA